MKKITTKATVKIFPQKYGWHYIEIPKAISDTMLDKRGWGLIPITATIGNDTWPTSLMPFGNGKYFIPLSAKLEKTTM